MINDKNFFVADEINKLGLRGIYLLFTGLTNLESLPAFEQYERKMIQSILSGITEESIDSDPILLGFRNLHTKVNKSNKKNVSSPENLYRLVMKRGVMPHVNLLVDIYNLISLKSKLALGAHDLQKIDGNISLRLTNGEETFIPLGADAPKPIDKGAYAYVDDSNEIICYLEVRQVEKTKVTLKTTNCFYIIQGNESTPPEYIERSVEELIDLTKKYCGGNATILARVW